MIHPTPTTRLRAPRSCRSQSTNRHHRICDGGQVCIEEDTILDDVAGSVRLLVVASVVSRGPTGAAGALW